MRSNIRREGIIFVIMFCVIGASVASAYNHESLSQTNPLTMRSILYVGGDGPGNYTTIQDAVDDAIDGDTIIVYSGIYYEDQVIVDKAILIQGAGWETTIIDGGDALLTETGLLRIIADGDVLLQGFTIRNAGGPSGYGSGDNKLNIGVAVFSSAPDVTYTITSNRIIGTQNPNDDYDWGFYAISGGQENIIFSYNIVTETGCNNIVVEKTTGSTDLCFNVLDAGCWGIDPVYYMTYGGTDIITTQMVRNNTIDVGTGINPGGATNNKVTGIGFSSAYLGCTGTLDSGKYTDIIITGNSIMNVKEWRRGIALDNFAWDDGSAGEILNAHILNNVISGVSDNPTSFGIRLSGLVSNTNIQGNEITGCDMSFWGRTGYYGGSTAYPGATNVHFNCFLGNSEGFVWEGPTILNAENNWWGDPSGPHHPDNPDGLGDNVSGSVDFSPWLYYYGPETSLPEVSITSPTKGYVTINIFGGLFTWKFKFFSTFAIGKIKVSVNASDPQSGIDRVEFYIDDVLKATVTTPPYEWIWAERGFFFPYTLKVIAYDLAGNSNADSMKVWKIW
jgi:hypothetical protein